MITPLNCSLDEIPDTIKGKVVYVNTGAKQQNEINKRIIALMGCCESTPTAPEVILPDPGEDEACEFTLKKAGMISSDYLCYQGDTTENDKKWVENTFFLA